jgi:pyruvate dehydrogenase E2 component (dihydrolipoamide acetyltransferase)
MPFTILMPKLSPTMEEGQIVRWHKKEGDLVKEGDLLFEVGTDKATVEYSAPEEGYLRKILALDGAMVALGKPVAIFTKSLQEPIEGFALSTPKDLPKKEETLVKEEKKKQLPSLAITLQGPTFAVEPPLSHLFFEEKNSEFHERILASPLARKLAQEQGLDLKSVKGSGPDGRIMSRDLSKAEKESIVSFRSKGSCSFAAGSYEEEKLSPMRQVIAKRLQEAKTFIPHFYLVQEIDASLLVEVRTELKNANIDVTFNDFIIKAAALSLREQPHVNSGFHSEHQTMIRFKTIDIALAVAMEGGLITPIIRFADYKNLGQISSEVKELVARAKEGKLKVEEYKGGSFTISNLGMYGTSEFMAILNPPQAAILAVGAIEDKPVIKANNVVSGKTLKLVLSADHRVVDGSDAALFLKEMKKFLENPALLLIG